MTLSGGILVLLLIGLGLRGLQVCSNRFMMLRRAKSFTPYWWGIGGILSLMLITFAVLAAALMILRPIH